MIKVKNLLVGVFALLAVAVTSVDTNAQGFGPGKGFKQLNFGIEFEGWGLPFYVGADFGVSDYITIGPRLSVQFENDNYNFNGNDYDQSWSLIVPSFRGDYHWGAHIDGLPEELDLYAGASLGIGIYTYKTYNPFTERVEKYTGSDAEFWIQLGARYYFAENWAAQLEFASYGGNGSLGVSYRF